MTDEEIAEEQIKKWDSLLYPEMYPVALVKDFIRKSVLAGLKAGRPERHDLRENPNDLPKDNDEKLCFYEKGKVVARYDSEYGCWETYFNNLETIIPSSVIIAWCEISVYTEE